MTSPRDRLLREVATRFLGRRAAIVAPVMLLALLGLSHSGAPRSQVAVLSVGFASMFCFFQYEAIESRTKLFSGARVRRSLQITLVGITLACAATGGLASPLLPILFAPVVVGLAAFGLTREHAALPGTLILSIVWIGLATIVAPFPAVPSPHRHVMLAAALLDSLLLVHVGVSAFTHAHAQLVDDLVHAREGLLSQALERTRSVESLGAKVAHEIKNPLASIRGLVELLGERVDNPRDARRLEVLQSEVQRLETLVHEYLTLARPLDALRREQTDLGRLVDEAIALLEGRARAAGVTLRWTAPATPSNEDVDGQRLLLALLNLLVNAIEASPGGATVAVVFAGSSDGPRLEIHDEGAGIAADLLPRLGLPYVTTKEGGTGLGVALARSIIEQHGGRLTFVPRTPCGTIVRIALLPTEDERSPSPEE